MVFLNTVPIADYWLHSTFPLWNMWKSHSMSQERTTSTMLLFFTFLSLLACSRQCQNGGIRDEETCTCICADGYSGDTCGSECILCYTYRSSCPLLLNLFFKILLRKIFLDQSPLSQYMHVQKLSGTSRHSVNTLYWDHNGLHEQCSNCWLLITSYMTFMEHVEKSLHVTRRNYINHTANLYIPLSVSL